MIEIVIRNSVSRGATGYKGVSRTTKSNHKFEAFVQVGQVSGFKKIYIGVYDTVAEAVQARVDFIISLL